MDDEMRQHAEEIRFLVVHDEGYQSIVDYINELPHTTGWAEICETIVAAFMTAVNDMVVARRCELAPDMLAFIATACTQDLLEARQAFIEKRTRWIASQN